MKVIEAQSAVLSNFEVYQHLSDLRKRFKRKKTHGPPNHQSAVTDVCIPPFNHPAGPSIHTHICLSQVLSWLQENPSPLSQKPIPYNANTITTLLERLRPYDLSKGEVVAILNIRPGAIPALNAIVDDMGDRFTEEQQYEMLAIIAEVLGEFPQAAVDQNGDAGDGGENGDIAMGNSTA
jgi:hypothetical protein